MLTTRQRFPVSGFLLLVALMGCESASPAADDEPQNVTGVKIEVIGVYREADVAFVRDKLKALLPADAGSRGWSASGNVFRYEVSQIDDVQAFAARIDFGASVHVDGGHIRVIYRYDNEVPDLPEREPKFYEERVEDRLGPALEKHDGDWWAALEELRITRQRNPDGRIIRLDLPSFTTTDEMLAHVAELSHLKKLNLPLARLVTDTGAKHLAGLTNLESLNLFGTSIGDPGQIHLGNLRRLKWLSLSGKGNEHGLRHIAGLTQLESLTVGHGLGYPVTTVGLSHLRRMTGLKELRLDGCEISDAGLKIIAEFSKLKLLRLQDAVVTDAGLAYLSDLKHLSRLKLNGCSQVGDAGVVHLGPLTPLTFLNLTGTGVTDEGVAHLRRLTNLHRLDLGGTAVSDASLNHLRSLPKLVSLTLSDTGIMDDGLKRLSELKQLTELWINGTKITDAGLKHLSAMTSLRTLDIGETSVTVAGLQHLAKLEDLNEIDVKDSGITEEELRAFRNR